MRATLVNVFLVGSGGFAGAVFRYALGGLVQGRTSHAIFPYSTLTVNLLGCLFIGLFTGLVDSKQLFTPEFRTFALIGLLGGFTTYSTFGYETFAMLRDAEYSRAAVNVGLHVVIGLVMVGAGYGIAASRWS